MGRQAKKRSGSAPSKKSLRRRIFEIIQVGNGSDFASRAFDAALVAAILLNILVLILQTFEKLSRFFPLFYAIEFATVIFFLVEYILRIWTADFLYPDTTPVRAALKYITSYDGIIELLTILPFFILRGFVVFRMLRVVRIFHLFRINKTYDSFNVIRNVLYEKRKQLLSSLFIILVLMLGASMTMYSVEHDVQPKTFSNALSGIWWSTSALLTVGYGDVYPITLAGKIVAVIIEFLGVGAVAIPTGIISAGFVEQYTKLSKQRGISDELPELSRLIVSSNSNWIGKTALDLAAENQIALVYVTRDGKVFVPDVHYNVELDDVLTICQLPPGISL